MTLRELMLKTLGKELSCPESLLDVQIYFKKYKPCKYKLRKYFNSSEFNVDICTSLIRADMWYYKQLPNDFVLVFRKFCGKTMLLLVPSEFVKN